MSELKLKVKKSVLKRKLDGVTVAGYYGRVITNGKKTFDEIARSSAKNTTLHPKEASLAAELLLEGVAEELKQGYIVDLGPLGTIYPAVNSPWKRDADDLTLSEMKPKVNYAASRGIASAIRGADLGWATEKDEKEGTETPSDDDDITQSNDNTGGDNTGGDDNGSQGGGSGTGGDNTGGTGGGDNGGGDPDPGDDQD
jgi:uncharacterized membrane protein YgcG